MDRENHSNIVANSGARRQGTGHRERQNKINELFNDDDDANESLPTILKGVGSVAINSNDPNQAKRYWKQLIEHYRTHIRQDSPQLFPGWVFNVLTSTELTSDQVDYFLQLALELNLSKRGICNYAHRLLPYTGIDSICFLAVYFGKWFLRSPDGCNWLQAALRKREQADPSRAKFDRFSELFPEIVEEFKMRVKCSTAALKKQKDELQRYDGVAEEFSSSMKAADIGSVTGISIAKETIPADSTYRNEFYRKLIEMEWFDGHWVSDGKKKKKQKKSSEELVRTKKKAPLGGDGANTSSDSESDSESEVDGSESDRELDNPEVEAARGDEKSLLDEPSIMSFEEQSELAVSPAPTENNMSPVANEQQPTATSTTSEHKRRHDTYMHDESDIYNATPSPSPSKRQKMNQDKKQSEQTRLAGPNDTKKIKQSTAEMTTTNAGQVPECRVLNKLKLLARLQDETTPVDAAIVDALSEIIADWVHSVELISSRDAEKLEDGLQLDSVFHLTRPNVQAVVCPLQVANDHWTCLHWDVAGKSVAVYDSSEPPVAEERVRKLCERLAAQTGGDIWNIWYKKSPETPKEHSSGIFCVTVLWHLAWKLSMPASIDTNSWRFFISSLAQQKTAADMEGILVSEPSPPTNQEVEQLAATYQLASPKASATSAWDFDTARNDIQNTINIQLKAVIDLYKQRKEVASAELAILKQLYRVVSEANRCQPDLDFYRDRLKRTGTSIELEEKKMTDEYLEDYTYSERADMLKLSDQMLDKLKHVQQHDTHAIETYNKTASLFAKLLEDGMVEKAEGHVKMCSGRISAAEEQMNPPLPPPHVPQ